MIAAVDLAWAAGYLDGEGCFMVADSRPRVVIGSTQVPPLRRMQELFGGSLGLDKGADATRKAKWRWVVSSNAARAVLALVEPFMVEKREQAAILALYPHRSHSSVRLTPAQVTLRADIDAWLRAVKTRGYPDSILA